MYSFKMTMFVWEPWKNLCSFHWKCSS